MMILISSCQMIHRVRSKFSGAHLPRVLTRSLDQHASQALNPSAIAASFVRFRQGSERKMERTWGKTTSEAKDIVGQAAVFISDESLKNKTQKYARQIFRRGDRIGLEDIQNLICRHIVAVEEKAMERQKNGSGKDGTSYLCGQSNISCKQTRIGNAMILGCSVTTLVAERPKIHLFVHVDRKIISLEIC